MSASGANDSVSTPEAGPDSNVDASDANIATVCPPRVPSSGGACAGNLFCQYDLLGEPLTQNPLICFHDNAQCIAGNWDVGRIEDGTFCNYDAASDGR
jgi:hypothetical protein